MSAVLTALRNPEPRNSGLEPVNVRVQYSIARIAH